MTNLLDIDRELKLDAYDAYSKNESNSQIPVNIFLHWLNLTSSWQKEWRMIMLKEYDN